MSADNLIGGLLVSVAVVAAYHLVLAPPEANVAGLEADVTALDARLRALEERVPRTATAGDPQVPARPEPIVGGESLPTAEAMATLERARAAARSAARQANLLAFEGRIRSLLADRKNLDPGDVREAAGLLADHTQAVRDLREVRKNAPPEEADALREREEELSRKLESDLARWLTSESARQLAAQAAGAASEDE